MPPVGALLTMPATLGRALKSPKRVGYMRHIPKSLKLLVFADPSGLLFWKIGF